MYKVGKQLSFFLFADFKIRNKTSTFAKLTSKRVQRKKNIAILGSTGSIGTQTLDVVREYPDDLYPYALTANKNVDRLIAQALEFKPKKVAIADERYYGALKDALCGSGIETLCGKEAIACLAADEQVDIVVTALVGYSGLAPTMKAIESGKTIALANKETLVVAGELITRMLRSSRSVLLPVDSEHSAIFQCLAGEDHKSISKLILTASGGPFRGRDYAYLQKVTPAEALRHPNWKMGAKVTVDSASMMNKGFEVIEASWLFRMKAEDIEVVVHPQSIVHSMVQFTDGSVKAQLGVPNMRLPIQYALGYPWRLSSDFGRLDWRQLHELTFEEPDRKTFRNLDLAYGAMRRGGNAPCVLNAANEVAVAAFLAGRCSFTGMSDVIERTLERMDFVVSPSLEDYRETDHAARRMAEGFVDIINS